MSTHILLRGDTAANWTASNPVLLAREPGLETDTTKTKYGDGVTAWNALPYSTPGTGTFAPALPSAGSFTYDGQGNPLTDPEGNTYTWNADGTPHTQTKGGVTRTFTWNANGTLASVA